jgi:DNA-binding CsgD family transcriptional regulator
VQSALALLRTTGARPRRLAVTGHDALTPAERVVVGLAVAGGTNREIAERRGVSTKAVEHHLGNAYRKLGVRSRAELIARYGSQIRQGV